jgi:hypothetical protein
MPSMSERFNPAEATALRATSASMEISVRLVFFS